MNRAADTFTPITDAQQAVMEAARQRRAHALKLQEDGLELDQIAGMLGVKVQRLKNMLVKARKEQDRAR